MRTIKTINFCIRLTPEDRKILTELRTKYAFNVSGNFKLFIREKLKQARRLNDSH